MGELGIEGIGRLAYYLHVDEDTNHRPERRSDVLIIGCVKPVPPRLNSDLTWSMELRP